jgi:hypothetical protein
MSGGRNDGRVRSEVPPMRKIEAIIKPFKLDEVKEACTPSASRA